LISVPPPVITPGMLPEPLSAVPGFSLSPSLASALRAAVRVAEVQLARTTTAWPPDTPAPVHTVQGKWYRPADLWTDWTPGFLAGQLWILERLSGAKPWRALAEAYTQRLAPRRFDRDVHDLGSIFLSSYGRWIERLDAADPLRARLEDVLVTAATVQSFRWNGAGRHGFIYSFNGPQSLFIDVMMNVRLLFWAAQHGAGSEVLRRALEHCRTSDRYLVRRQGKGLGEVDGSVAHEAIFNTEPGRGEFRCLSTQQGYSPFTCWARGLAWAIYGFAEAYRYSGEVQFLEAAELCARFFEERTPPDGVPYWDYGAPGLPAEPRDSSAAAIAGCGLLILSRLVAPERGPRHFEGAARIAASLASAEYLASPGGGEEGVLLHGVYHRPRGWGVDASVMWGDYFFLELVERLLDVGPAPPAGERLFPIGI
jgi:unsaturated chondroitin disaccharide hydrolase